jgi:activating signal cointegrator complex subunit 3
MYIFFRKPALIFVSSRYQTRLTAQALISYAAADDSPTYFLNMSNKEVEEAQV